MTPLMASLRNVTSDFTLPQPANKDEAPEAAPSEQRLVGWLFRSTAQNRNALGLHPDSSRYESGRRFLAARMRASQDDWELIATLCGHAAPDFFEAGVEIPLSTAEIDHFRRNHRGTDSLVSRDFLSSQSHLPSPLAELYGLYRHRARLDAESTLFVAQATTSTRLGRVMSDLLAIGAFASGNECVSHLTKTYTIAAAFDTSDLIDKASDEAQRRLSLPIDHPAHLLKLGPDEISVLASNIVEKHLLSEMDFLDKAGSLAEARQDVNRLPARLRLTTALTEGDLPEDQPWVQRLLMAYKRIFGAWALPEASKTAEKTGSV